MVSREMEIENMKENWGGVRMDRRAVHTSMRSMLYANISVKAFMILHYAHLPVREHTLPVSGLWHSRSLAQPRKRKTV